MYDDADAYPEWDDLTRAEQRFEMTLGPGSIYFHEFEGEWLEQHITTG